MIALTTTAVEIDEELLNRCLVLTIDEGRQQTAAIHAAQRERRTLAGLHARAEREALLKTHQDAQRLLEPLAVVNPYARRLTFLDDRTRTRRDHEKYLTLIDTITLLHQHQREVKTLRHGDQTLRYVEVTLEDITIANRLAHPARDASKGRHRDAPTEMGLCFSWALMLILTLYYFSAFPKAFNMGAVNASSEIAHRQLVVIVRTSVGLGLAVIALFTKRLRPFMLIASSLLYLIQWHFTGPMRLVGAVAGYKLLWQTSSKFGLQLDFAIRDFLVPSALAMVLIGSIGINTYSYVRSNPLRYVDPFGLDVYLCQQPAFGIAWNPIDHYWIKTDTAEAGIGGTRGNEPGNQSGDLPGDPVQVVNHKGRSMQPNASCRKVDDEDENKVQPAIEDR